MANDRPSTGIISIDYKGLGPQYGFKPHPVRVYDGTIWELVQDKEALAGSLALVPRPDDHFFGGQAMKGDLYPKIMAYIRYHKPDWVSVKDIAKLYPGRGLGLRLTRLWINGHLDKAAQGLYIGAIYGVEKYRRRKSDTPGEFWGVHYRFVKDL